MGVKMRFGRRGIRRRAFLGSRSFILLLVVRVAFTRVSQGHQIWLLIGIWIWMWLSWVGLLCPWLQRALLGMAILRWDRLAG